MTNTTIANQLYPTANGLVSSNPFVDQFAPRDPAPTDTQYPIQKKWLNTNTDAFWELESFSSFNGITTANWVLIGSHSAVTETLTGNTGGPVPPTLNNINVVGDGIYTTTSGNPGTSTLTILAINQNIALNYTNVTHAMSPYTVLTTDYYISVDCSAGVVSLLFPNAPTFKRQWIVKDRTGNASTFHISITTVGGAVTIDGQTTYLLTSNHGAVNLLANSTPTYEVY